MNTIEEIIKKRFKFLYKLYELSDGDERYFRDMYEIGKELNYDEKLVYLITQYLGRENLIKNVGSSKIGITHWGIREVEDAVSYPNEDTEHFPGNIISIGTMIHSQIQQSSNKTSKRITNTNNLSEFNYITISDSVIGSLNLGEIKKIDVSMAVFKKSDNEEIIKPLKELTEAIINEKELDRELRNEILEQLSFLSIQANLQKEQRVKKGIIKLIFDRIKTVISTIPALISLWDKLQPLFDKFFS